MKTACRSTSGFPRARHRRKAGRCTSSSTAASSNSAPPTPPPPPPLYTSTSFAAILIKPAYRLNLFGFLVPPPTPTQPHPGNYGFYDLRLALEWTYTNISYFSGNPANITVGGYSAGAHCAFYQLAYDISLPESKRIIRRLVMHSNGPGPAPRPPSESQAQYLALLQALSIPASLPVAEQLAALRSLPASTLLAAANTRPYPPQFRASPGGFISPALFSDIRDGSFATRLREANVRILIGECSDEHFAYARWHAPTPSLRAVETRLHADYSRRVVRALVGLYFPSGKVKDGKGWREAFGRVYADVQVHCSIRGFIAGLVKGGAGGLVSRYRVEWRAGCVRQPVGWGASHGSDMAIWFYGDGGKLTEGEGRIVREGLLDLYGQFLAGEEVDWGTRDYMDVRRLKADGSVDIWRDELWEHGLEVWDAVQDASLGERAAL
ncbi:alpha/beta-hydrolase [Trichodelitschia bisporula]|uniref:Alpha/beta-hydrolase n=1 Tax=Trichodelitschia bisporula TaxID=703511 RepID=A0A6G1I6Z7_9PEZI|nr:alpha/beta-hydrolase [Trichodelitschia bisporula]